MASKQCVLLFLVSLVFSLSFQLTSSVSPNDSKNREIEDRIIYADELTLHQHSNYHQKFHHDPEYHREHHIPLPGANKSETQIPLDFIQKLNDLPLNDLLLNFVEGYNDNPTIFTDRFGDGGINERNGAIIPKDNGGCIPELKIVDIANSSDPTVIYIPSCTRVERCGGCCKHPLLSCQPTESELLSFQIYKTQYTGGKKLRSLDKEVVQIEKHNKCSCSCILQAKDCNIYQEYKKNSCTCVCKNLDEEKKCIKQYQMKLWNPESCACQCRNIRKCSTGSHYDFNECRCKMEPERRRFAPQEMAPIEPLYDGDY